MSSKILHYYFLELLTPVDFSMGETILNTDVLSGDLLFLVSGEIRQLVTHPSSPSKFFTLEIHQFPYVVGWTSIQSQQPLEFYTAATDCRLLKISRSVFFDFIHSHPSVFSSSCANITSCELWNIVKDSSFLTIPSSAKDLRKWIKWLCIESRIVLINSYEDLDKYSDPSFNWIVASYGLENLQYGSLFDHASIRQQSSFFSQPLRLIGFPSRLWIQNTNIDDFKPSDLTLSSPPPITSGDDNNDEENITQSVSSGRDDFSEISSIREQFRFFSSPCDPVEEAVACFRTIADVLNLPIKRDVLFKILQEQTSRGDGSVSLQLCAAIAETLGLQTQLINLPVALIGRLQTPAFVHLADGELSVALASRNAELLLSRPRVNIEIFTVEQLLPFADENKNLPVLLLRTTDRTPQKKFGLSWFLPSIKKNKKPLIEVLIASLFVQLFQLMNPLIVQQIVDKVIGQNGMSTLPVLAVLLFSFSVFENILTAVRTNLFIDTTNRIDLSLGEQVIDHLLRLPLNYFDRRPVGELSSRLAELEQIRSFLTGTALTVVLDSVFSVIYIIVMLFYSWILTIVALLVAPLLALLTFSTSPIIRRQLRSKAQLNAKTQNHLVEVLTGIQTVKAQNFELKARWRWKERYSKYVAEGFRNAVTSTTTSGLTQFLNQASTLSVLCVGAYLVLEGQLTLGQLIAFRIIAGYVTGPLLRLSNLYQNFQQTSIALERLSDIIDTPQESTDSDKKNIPLPTIAGKVEYMDVSFRFGNDGPLQLSQVNLTIPSGEFVAIVGQSGSGKSTLTKLLPRLYEPLSGRILVDDTDISKVELYSLRRQIGIVPQDSLLFEGSVQDNIALSNPEATTEDVISAARIACAHEFIMSLPQGYASPVGERGGSLSGGQRQRIAIARTVLQNPRLLIMDEATSALDYETERLVSLNLMEFFRGRTVLFITHRLNSITHSDRIIMMHKGQVDEQGAHSDLISQRGRYYALFKQQEGA